eukprot:g77700.t1
MPGAKERSLAALAMGLPPGTTQAQPGPKCLYRSKLLTRLRCSNMISPRGVLIYRLKQSDDQLPARMIAKSDAPANFSDFAPPLRREIPLNRDPSSTPDWAKSWRAPATNFSLVIISPFAHRNMA